LVVLSNCKRASLQIQVAENYLLQSAVQRVNSGYKTLKQKRTTELQNKRTVAMQRYKCTIKYQKCNIVTANDKKKKSYLFKLE